MRSLLVLTLIFVSTASLHAEVVIGFNYNDAAGAGFNAPGATGQTRRSALQLAATNFATAFSKYTANIVMDVIGTATGSTLAPAADNGGNSFSAGFGTAEVIRNKVLAGTDLNLGTADGEVNVNFSTVEWELDINTTPPMLGVRSGPRTVNLLHSTNS